MIVHHLIWDILSNYNKLGKKIFTYLSMVLKQFHKFRSTLEFFFFSYIRCETIMGVTLAA